MTFTVALIADPWFPWMKARNTNLEPQIKKTIQTLPATDMLWTATSRHAAYPLLYLFKYNGSKHHNIKHKNHMLMSRQWEKSTYNHKTQTYTYSNTPNAVLVNTREGLVNINAENDAITRMLSNKRPKPDLVLIIDPDQLLTRNRPSPHTISSAVIHAHIVANQLGLNVQVIP